MAYVRIKNERMTKLRVSFHPGDAYLKPNIIWPGIYNTVHMDSIIKHLVSYGKSASISLSSF